MIFLGLYTNTAKTASINHHSELSLDFIHKVIIFALAQNNNFSCIICFLQLTVASDTLKVSTDAHFVQCGQRKVGLVMYKDFLRKQIRYSALPQPLASSLDCSRSSVCSLSVSFDELVYRHIEAGIKERLHQNGSSIRQKVIICLKKATEVRQGNFV